MSYQNLDRHLVDKINEINFEMMCEDDVGCREQLTLLGTPTQSRKYGRYDLDTNVIKIKTSLQHL